MKTERKLVRVRAAQYQETIWEEVRPGRTCESVAVLQTVLEQAERRHLLTFARLLAQYGVRTASAEKAGGYYYAILFTCCPSN